MWNACQFFIWFMMLQMTYYSPSLSAAPVLHLLFHMGAGAEDHFYVGGTLENRGDEDIYQGFVVITPLDQRCYPLQPKLQPFGLIKSGQKLTFRIPINGRLYGYKLDTFHGVNDVGNKIDIIDETAAILAEKQFKYIDECKRKRVSN